MVVLKQFLLMIQFLTAIPLRIKLEVDAKDFGKGLVFAPLVGFIIGGMLCFVYTVLRMVFPAGVTSVLIITAYILFTGGLHLDGLGDTFDGIFSNRPKERILEIMRDSRVGTNAVLGIVSVLALNMALLTNMKSTNMPVVLLLMPAAGRIGSLVGAGVSKYARSGEGLGKSFIDYCGIREIIIGLFVSLPVFYASAGLTGLMVPAFSSVTALLLVKVLGSKISGATGDILGAVCELNQTLFLMLANILQTSGF